MNRFFYYMETKICTKCCEVKSLEDFEKNKNSTDSRTGVCKKCINLRRKIKYQEKNKDKLKKVHVYSEDEKINRSIRMKKRWESTEFKEKMVIQSKELWRNDNYKNKTLSKMQLESTRKLLSEKLKGKKRSNETIKKMSNGRKDKVKIVENGIQIYFAGC